GQLPRGWLVGHRVVDQLLHLVDGDLLVPDQHRGAHLTRPGPAAGEEKATGERGEKQAWKTHDPHHNPYSFTSTPQRGKPLSRGRPESPLIARPFGPVAPIFAKPL